MARTAIKMTEVPESIAKRQAFETNGRTMRGFHDVLGVYGVYSYNTCIAQFDGAWRIAEKGGYAPHREVLLAGIQYS